ncbi:MAG: hypothetical protein CMH56_06350 [Myxococcales bacterium]|nr:hypothetical protein [Myxococcales bacterium]
MIQLAEKLSFSGILGFYGQQWPEIDRKFSRLGVFMRFSFLMLWLATMPILALANPDAGPADQPDAGLGHNGSPTQPNQPKITPKTLTPEVFERLTPIFSGVASLQTQGKEVFSKIAGHADARAQTPILKSTRFPICSVSKHFTAVAVLRLVEQEKVNIDEPLHTYVKGMTPIQKDGKVCTVRNAMNHLCGFDREFTSLNDGNHLADREVRDAYVTAMNEAELVNTPGTKRLYTNVGYDALGILVQDVSGQDFETFLKEQFFNPLGMTNTGVETPLDADPQQHVRGLLWMKWLNFDAASTLMFPSNFASTIGASGNIYSTVDDLHRWNRALHTGQILKPKTYAELVNIPEVNKHTNTEGLTSTGGYAGGLIVGTYDKNGLEVIWHNGALVPYNFSSFIGWAPQTQTSFVMLSNHAMFVSQTTKTGLQILEWQHGLIDEVASPKLPWPAYLFLIFFALIFGGLPFILYFYGQLFRKGHRKGNTKAFSALLTHTVYTPFFLLMVWGGPVRGPIIFSVFVLLSVVGLIKRFQFFQGALDGLSKGQILKIFVPHVLVTFFVGSMDQLGAFLIVAGLIVLLITYTVRNGRPSPGLG